MISLVSANSTQILPSAPWLRRFPVRSPTLPPATHTNVYLVGGSDLLIIDPASPFPEEQARLILFLDDLARTGLTPKAVFLTHHHHDHIAGAAALCQARNLPLLAHPETLRRLPGRLPQGRPIHDGDHLPFSPNQDGLLVLHTPGHAPGHLCLFDPHSGDAIVGDMVASVGTILIDPEDDGDMRTYLAQLARLRDLRPARLWPAHGAAILQPHEHLSFYLHHRLMREQKVLSALHLGPASLKDLLPLAYDDTPEAAYPLAIRSLRAHLDKLRAEGRATLDPDERWHPIPG
jgi:glyoxylase-like metal-dependent hydrolase (beta-lactamase superfamily II)